jgi:hypothetical protein
MKNLFKKLFSDELPLEAQIFNVTLAAGSAGYLAAGLTRIAIGAPYLLIVSLLVFSGVLVTLIYLANRTRAYRAYTYATVVIVCFISLPGAFFFLGGQYGRMAAYFVLGLSVLFLLLRARACFISVALYLAVVAALYFVADIPAVQEFIMSLSGGEEYLREIAAWDALQTISVVGLCLGIIFLFQTRIYITERAKAQAAAGAVGTCKRMTQTI